MKRTRRSKKVARLAPGAALHEQHSTGGQNAVVKPRPTDGISEQVELVPNV